LAQLTLDKSNMLDKQGNWKLFKEHKDKEIKV